MMDTIFSIIWAVTFIAGWVCVHLFKKKKNRLFYKIALVMFGIDVIISAYMCLFSWIQ